MWQKFLTFLLALTFRLVCRLSRMTGHIPIRTELLDAALSETYALANYAERSGHLRHRYHAGRRVKQFSMEIEGWIIAAGREARAQTLLPGVAQ